MSDWDDFEDYEDDGYMEEDSFGDEFDEFADDPNDPSGPDDLDDTDDGLPREGHEGDGFTARDSFFIESIAGNAYEEGLDERKRMKIKRKRWRNPID